MNRVLILVLLLALPASAMLNPVSDVNYNCTYPITIGGMVGIGNSGNPGADALDKAASNVGYFCVCPAPPPVFERFGVPFGMNLPSHIVETTTQPMNFPSLGIKKSGNVRKMGGSDASGVEAGREIFVYSHIHKFSIMQILNIFQDVLCLKEGMGGGFDIMYMSEIDPMAESSSTAMLMFPETALLANPITAAACAADSVSTLGGATIDPMYWCVGGHTILPLANRTVESGSYEDASSITVAKSMYRLNRITLGKSFGATAGQAGVRGCSSTAPAPTIIKSQHRFQTALPIRGSCERMGTPSIKWNIGKRSTIQGGDKVDILWTRQDCCAL